METTSLGWVAIVLAVVSGISAIIVARINQKGVVSQETIDGLRKELSDCKKDADAALERVRQEMIGRVGRANELLEVEVDKRRELEGIVAQLKDDLARKNESLIAALIDRQQYVRRKEDLKD